MKSRFLLYFLLIPILLSAQPYAVRQLGIEKGLSNNYVVSIAQDKEGFLWFATEEGLNKFPEEQYFLMSLINNYIYSNRNEKAIEYLNTAIAKDSNNPQLYDVMGRVYETGLKDYAKAEEYFKKALAINPDYIESLSNLGRVYYNQGVNKQGEANMINDAKQYQEELGKAKEFFKQALPYFEKAHQMKPEEREYMTALRGIYYNLNMGDKFDAIEAEMNK